MTGQHRSNNVIDCIIASVLLTCLPNDVMKMEEPTR